MERFGAARVLVPALLAGAAATAALGYAATSVPLLSAVLFLVGLFVGMGASGAIALATLTYPTPIRSTGIGWAMGMGRFAQVLAPLFTTAMAAASWTDSQVFAMLGLAPLLAAAAVLTLRLAMPGLQTVAFAAALPQPPRSQPEGTAGADP
jgi:AAHS family 4-hydroxybenzoate transporter-like MFS transporter